MTVYMQKKTDLYNLLIIGPSHIIMAEMAGKAYSDEGKPFQSPGRMKNSSYYIAPAGDRTHNLPLTAAST